MRGPHLSVLSSCVLIGLMLTACTGPTDEAQPAGDATTTAPSPKPVTEEILRTCPEGDALWFRATKETNKEEMPELRALMSELMVLCPDRWEPRWVFAETLYQTRGSDQARTEECRRLFAETLGEARSLDSPMGIARSLDRLARLRKADLDIDNAERLYREALLEASRAGPEADLFRAYTQNELVDILNKTGRFGEALELIAESIATLSASGKSSHAAVVGHNRGKILVALGKLVESREVQENFYQWSVDMGSERFASAAAVSLGNLDRILRQWDSAREWFNKVSPDQRGAMSGAKLGLGRVALRQGALEEASRHLAELESYQPPKARLLFGQMFMAEIELRSGDPERAIERLEPVLRDPKIASFASIAWIGNRLLGKALAELPGRESEAIEKFRLATKIIEEESRNLVAEDAMGLLHERAEVFADLAATLARFNREPDEILDVVEQAHARVLKRAVEGEPGHSTVDLSSLRSGLKDDEVLLDYLIGDDQGVVLAISPDDIQVEVLPGWSSLRDEVNQYRNVLKRPLVKSRAGANPMGDLARYLDKGRELRRMLLGPVERSIAGARRIYIVPDQDLALLPFAALPLDSRPGDSGPRFLGGEKETAVLPMAGIPPADDGARGPFLLAGDPLPDAAREFDRLRLADEELSGVRAVWSGETATTLTREALRPERFRELDLASYRTLHFATHAVASTLDPRRCAVIFSEGSKLAMQEIAALELGPALVVLSACQTGDGEVVPGEGVVGLSWAFLRAGAQGVAASLWSVEDESTSELMVAFHRFLREGNDPVGALSLAQREVASRRPHPAYWAPFTLILSP